MIRIVADSHTEVDGFKGALITPDQGRNKKGEEWQTWVSSKVTRELPFRLVGFPVLDSETDCGIKHCQSNYFNCVFIRFMDVNCLTGLIIFHKKLYQTVIIYG